MASGRTFLLAVAVLVLPVAVRAQTDFENYVEAIRKAGMTESASGDIQEAASLLSGGTSLKVTRAPDGSIGRSYSSNLCFIRTKDARLLEKQRALRAAVQTKQDAWVKFLREQADTDRSGFVNTEEGSSLRQMVDLGLTAVQLGVSTLDELAKATPEDKADTVAHLASYSHLLTEAKKRGLEGMPELPIGLEQRSGDGGSRPTTR